MTDLRFTLRALDHLDRIADHLLAHEAADVVSRVAEIVDALQLLRLHPLIGRPSGNGQRELVIGRGTRGYVALYVYDEARDEVAVNALRGQREAGFREGT